MVKENESLKVTAKSSAVPGSVNLDSVAADIATQSPEPSTSFIEKTAADKQETDSEFAHLRDKLGYTFDATLHYTDDGKPKINADGTLKRRRIRKKKTTEAEILKGGIKKG